MRRGVGAEDAIFLQREEEGSRAARASTYKSSQSCYTSHLTYVLEIGSYPTKLSVIQKRRQLALSLLEIRRCADVLTRGAARRGIKLLLRSGVWEMTTFSELADIKQREDCKILETGRDTIRQPLEMLYSLYVCLLGGA